MIQAVDRAQDKRFISYPRCSISITRIKGIMAASTIPRALLSTLRASRVLRLAPRLAIASRSPSPRVYRTFTTTPASFATPTSAPSSSIDPANIEAQKLLDTGSIALESGDVQEAVKLYERCAPVRFSPLTTRVSEM